MVLFRSLMGYDLTMAKRRPRPTTRRSAEEKLLTNKRVLIVCEGEQTEKNYFCGLRRTYRLPTLNVVSSESGRNAANILRDACKRFDKAMNNKEPFSDVYCVFDRDDDQGANVSFQPTINKISKLKNFHAIYSIPSFEFWLLLHFIYTRQCFATPKHLLDCLEKAYPAYQKNQLKLFDHLQENLDIALQHAACCEEEAKEYDEKNPSTQVHHLIHFLQELRDVR